VIAGLRPEHFEDASLVADRARGVTFKAKIDVLESMGSEFYAYFVVESEAVSSSELDELAADAGGADLPGTEGGVQVTVRLGAESQVQQGAEAELWFDSTHLQLFDTESGRSLLARDGAPTSTQAPTPTQTPAATPPQAPPAS
jgi:multiple sugar transport system ATP-binding protein